MLTQETAPENLNFGRYRLIARLGSGGMSTVHLAVGQRGPKHAREPVVLKLLHENLQKDEDFVSLFSREARIAGELSHENIVRTHTVGAHEGRQYIVMEYLRGVSLGAVMRQSQEWSLRDRLPLLGAMCLALTGLHYAHEFLDHRGSHLRLVHRDFKPDNVFITTDGRVKLLDFGVAKVNSPEFEATLGTSLRGTVHYMSPEALQPDREVDRRADLFAAGVMIAELATGKRYWGDQPYTRILAQLSSGELPALPATADEELPPAVVRLCEKALAPEPDDRFLTALELRVALMKVLRTQGYRIDIEDLAAVVRPMAKPAQVERDRAIRQCMLEIDGADAAASDAFHTPPISDTTPDGLGQEHTETGMHTPPSPAPPAQQDKQKNRWLPLVLLLLLVPVGWFAWTSFQGDSTPETAPAVTPAAAGAKTPSTAPAGGPPPKVAAEAPPQPAPAEPAVDASPTAVPADAAPTPTPTPTPSAGESDTNVADASSPATSRRPRRRKRRGREQPREPTPTPPPTPAASPPEAPREPAKAKPAGPAAKSEMEPNPYAR